MKSLNPLPLLVLALLVALQPALAQTGNATAKAHLPLWKIEGITNQVYLLGSIHVLKESNYPLAAPINSAFSNAQVVAFEVDIDEMTNPAMQMKVAAQGMLPAGETLKDHLSAETYGKLMAYAEKARLPEAALMQLKPVLAVMMLLQMDLMKLDLQPENGVDQHFFRLTKKSGKKVVPLETVDFQVDRITGFTKEEGELMVKSTLKEMDSIRKTLGDIVKAWETGDAKALEKLLNEATAETPAIMKRMLTDRNQNWIPKIQEMINSGKNAIVIVGAAHLVGDKGVVDLLQKKGFKVTQQ